MAKITISLCALLGFLLVFVSVGETSQRIPCCTKFQTEPIPVRRLCGYSMDRTCRLNAVKFFTVRDRTVCADPTQQWVKDAMENIKNSMVTDETAALCRKHRQ